MSFFFVDPPYYNTSNDFSASVKKIAMEFDHQALHKYLSKLKGKFLLTINDDPYIRELYREFNIIDNKVAYSVSQLTGKTDVNELIITNYGDINTNNKLIAA